MRRATEGFTLVEMVVALVIMGIMSAGAAMGIAEAVNFYAEASEETDLSLDGWGAMERISRELRHAAFPPVTGENFITFTRPSASAAMCPECVDNSTMVTFRFIPEDNRLWRETSASGRRLLAANVASFSVAENAVSGKVVYAVSLTLSANPADASSRQLDLRTSVYPAALREPGWMEAVR